MKRIVAVLLVIALGFALVSCGGNENSKNRAKVLSEYQDNGSNFSDKNHVIISLTLEELFDKLDKKETFAIYFGFPTCPWCKEYITYINEVAKEEKIETVYYFNQKNIRNYSWDSESEKMVLNSDFQKLIEYFENSNLLPTKEYCDCVDENQKEIADCEDKEAFPWIYAPTVMAIKNGELVDLFATVSGHDRITGEDDRKYLPALTTVQKETLINEYRDLFSKIK